MSYIYISLIYIKIYIFKSIKILILDKSIKYYSHFEGACSYIYNIPTYTHPLTFIPFLESDRARYITHVQRST